MHARELGAFHATRRHDVRSSVLFVGQTVRARIGSRWLPGVVEAVCKEPNSYSVRLVDGRVFRRTRWAINNVQAPTSSTASATQVRSLRFPEVHAEVLSSAAAHQQAGVELTTLATPSTRTRSSLTHTAPAGSTGVGEAMVNPPEAMLSSTAFQLPQQFEIPSSIGGPFSSPVSSGRLEPMRTRSGRPYSRQPAQ